MKRVATVLLVCVLLALPSAARADIAPPKNPPGPNLEPGSETTQVRMLAETVVIDVHKDAVPNSLGSASVTADFTMHNTGSQDESMAVRFPIAASDGRDGYPELTNLGVKVNGRGVSTHRVSYPEPAYMGKDVPWAEFPVDFPAGQDVAVEVTYGLKGSGYFPYTAFYYILDTGAGWQGTIGSADIILRLPYEASPQNVVLDMEIGWATTTPGGVMQGNEVRWHFDDFEPGPDGTVDNMQFALVAPSAWQAVLKERTNVAANAKDGEAWGRLGKAYKSIYFMNKGYRTDPGGEGLYGSAVDAYEKCLGLLPNDAQWHAGFADLLASRSYWNMYGSGPTPDTYRAFDEIRTALQLAPNDSKVQAIAEQMAGMFPDAMVKNGTGYDFPWLTATPTVNPSLADISTPTEVAAAITPEVTQPAVQAATPVAPSAAPTSKPASPICGTAALLPLALAFWASRKRRG